MTTLKSSGYRISLYFLWVDNVDIALGRVADRVRRGGHNVPEKIIHRRFDRGLPNLFNLYRPLLDLWAIFDNSTDHPVMIACEEDGDLEVFDSVLFSKYGEAMKEEKLDKNLSNKSMTFCAEEALKKVVAHTIADHKRTGDPIVIWRDGKVVKVPADQIEVREPEAEYGNPKENGK